MELSLNLENIDLREFCGINNKNFRFIETIFPHLELTERSERLLISGEEKDLQDFETFFKNLRIAYENQGYIDEKIIMSVLHQKQRRRNPCLWR